MGLARKQRDRLATANQADRCFGACPTFTKDQASAAWSARDGDRHRAITVPRDSCGCGHGASPLSRSRFLFELTQSLSPVLNRSS